MRRRATGKGQRCQDPDGETQESAALSAVTQAATPGEVAVDDVTSTGFGIAGIDANGNPATVFYAIEVDGLYLVGAGTHPGAGMPGVISSAKVLDEIVPDP